jgi:uncharacterized protein (DUF2235 family)
LCKPEEKVKSIVICCDGTGNEFGENNTNVVETYALSKKADAQIVFYDPGVGTGGWEYSESTGNLKALKDQATGRGLQINVNDAYGYLMETFEEGDKLKPRPPKNPASSFRPPPYSIQRTHLS